MPSILALPEPSLPGSTTAMLRPCAHPACGLLSFGVLCVRHDEPVTRTFVRGRPFVAPPTATDVAECYDGVIR